MIKALIVEDDPSQIFMYQIAFEKKGINSTFVASYEEILKSIDTDRPDIILLDIVLGKEDGLSILEKLKQDEKTKDIPVTMFTNTTNSEKEEKAKSLGAIDYIIKSRFYPHEIVDKLKGFLGRTD